MQTKIPCVIMRGGTSRGPFFHLSDLPGDTATRDAVLLAVMGSPHEIQVDGIGGAHSVTSKVAMVSQSQRPGVDVDYLFAQVEINERRVDTKPNCGNCLANASGVSNVRGNWPFIKALIISTSAPVTPSEINFR